MRNLLFSRICYDPDARMRPSERPGVSFEHVASMGSHIDGIAQPSYSIELVRFESGAEYPAHRHSHPEYIYVLDGELADGGELVQPHRVYDYPEGSIQRLRSISEAREAGPRGQRTSRRARRRRREIAWESGKE